MHKPVQAMIRVLLSLAVVASAALAMTSPAAASEATDLAIKYYKTLETDAYDREALAKFYADDFVDHNRSPGSAGAGSDRDAMLGLLEALAGGFPDGKRALGVVEPAGADKAVVYFTFSGTSSGNFFGMSPTDKPVVFNGIDIFRVENGVFAEQWHVEDIAALMAQLNAK